MVLCKMKNHHLLPHKGKGMTLVEVVIAAGVMVTVFFAIVTGFRLALVINTQVQAKTVAISLANERIEFIRSLDYDEIGTVGGIPQGPIPQIATTTANNREYQIRTLIYWVDDPADGLGVDDVNNITTDYKEIKVEVNWSVGESEQSLFKVARITPRGIETTEDGGSLLVTVYDALFEPLQGAEVRILNTNATTTIDTVRMTNDTGVALFAGAPPLSQYQIFVTRPGFSTDQTYVSTTTNPNPNTQPITVAAGETSSISFQIDRLSSLEIQTFNAGNNEQFLYNLEALGSEIEYIDTELVSDELVLSTIDDNYSATGTALLPPVVPASISRWEVFRYELTTMPNVAVATQFFGGTSTSTLTLIPNEDLANNETGISSNVIDLSQLDSDQYPIIRPFLTLTSTVATSTPAVSNIQLSYVTNETNADGVDIRIRGSKLIGLGSGGESIRKFDNEYVTDGQGRLFLDEVEWDEYDIEVFNGNVIRQSCPHVPVRIAPDTSNVVSLSVVSAPPRSLRVGIIDSDRNPIYDATVTLVRESTSYSESVTTDICGQAWFSDGVVEGDDYEIQVSAPGFESREIDDVEITEQEVETIQLFTL